MHKNSDKNFKKDDNLYLGYRDRMKSDQRIFFIDILQDIQKKLIWDSCIDLREFQQRDSGQIRKPWTRYSLPNLASSMIALEMHWGIVLHPNIVEKR